MGANAQTAVPTFTTGQVLTADQQNQSARTGVPVFATTTTRDAAFGGTGEKTLAEGQLCYVEGTGLQSYNGSAWVTWGTAPTSGLAVVKAETAFSAVAAVNCDSVFTSTYTNYRIISRISTSTTNNVSMRLRTGGTAATTNYNYSYILNTTAAAASATAQASWLIFVQTDGAYPGLLVIDICGPQLTDSTSFVSLYETNVGGYTAPRGYFNSGNHSTATSYDGFDFTVSTGTMTGSYTVYGYGKS